MEDSISGSTGGSSRIGSLSVEEFKFFCNCEAEGSSSDVEDSFGVKRFGGFLDLVPFLINGLATLDFLNLPVMEKTSSCAVAS